MHKYFIKKEIKNASVKSDAVPIQTKKVWQHLNVVF